MGMNKKFNIQEVNKINKEIMADRKGMETDICISALVLGIAAVCIIGLLLYPTENIILNIVIIALLSAIGIKEIIDISKIAKQLIELNKFCHMFNEVQKAKENMEKLLKEDKNDE